MWCVGLEGSGDIDPWANLNDMAMKQRLCTKLSKLGRGVRTGDWMPQGYDMVSPAGAV